MHDFLLYVFYPNPGHAGYADAWMTVSLIACGVLVVGSFAVRFWRSKLLQNSITKKLSKTWSPAMFWFGVVGLVLLISRVEKIQFIAMRFLWVLWVIAVLLYLFAQWKIFRSRHYAIIPTVKTGDPRDKYLPKRKK